MKYGGKINNNVQLFAICLDNSIAVDIIGSPLKRGKLYEVEMFVEKKGFEPIGTILKGIHNVYYMQRFEYFVVNLN